MAKQIKRVAIIHAWENQQMLYVQCDANEAEEIAEIGGVTDVRGGGKSYWFVQIDARYDFAGVVAEVESLNGKQSLEESLAGCRDETT